MSQFKKPKGTRDFLPLEMAKRNKIKEIVINTFDKYGYHEILTPTFEEFDLLAERSGEEIREKMFTFVTDETEYALRPEITASVCRIISEDALQIPKPYKLYYICSCFRYEQPQAGRYREYWQAGIELIGNTTLIGDAEVITIAVRILQNIGLKDFKLKLGNIGIFRNILKENNLDFDLQNKIISDIDKLMSIREKCQAIKLKFNFDNNDISYMKAKFEDLYNLQQEIDYIGNFEVPLLINFDENFVKEWLDKLPSYIDDTTKFIWNNLEGIKKELGDFILKLTYLSGKKSVIIDDAKELLKNTTAEKPFNDLLKLCEFLEVFGINDYDIVLGVARGLDYYTDMVFEIDCPLLGAQKQVCGGGRYDKLISEFNGPDTPAVGFGIGFDRIIEALEKTNTIEVEKKIDIFIATINRDMKLKGIEIAEKLRKMGKSVEMDLTEMKLREQLGFASTLGVKSVIIIGPRELENNEITVKDMITMEQKKIKITELYENI